MRKGRKPGVYTDWWVSPSSSELRVISTAQSWEMRIMSPRTRQQSPRTHARLSYHRNLVTKQVDGVSGASQRGYSSLKEAIRSPVTTCTRFPAGPHMPRCRLCLLRLFLQPLPSSKILAGRRKAAGYRASLKLFRRSRTREELDRANTPLHNICVLIIRTNSLAVI